MNVVLIGLSGSGKSSVGKLLAQRLGWVFVDTDREVEMESGLEIHEIFDREGEAGFRRRESQAVCRALGGECCVVSVGAGAVVEAANRARIAGGNVVVLLEAETGTLLERLRKDERDEPRPMLAVADPAGRLAALKAARDPIYRAVANLMVSTEGLSIKEIATSIACSVQAMGAMPVVRKGDQR